MRTAASPPARGRSTHLNLALTPGELAEVRRRAAEAGLGLSEWARAALLGDAVEQVAVRGRPRRRTPEDQAILDDIARDAREITAEWRERQRGAKD